MITCSNILPDQISVYPTFISSDKLLEYQPHLTQHHFEMMLSEKEQQSLMEDISIYLTDKVEGTVFSFFSMIDNKTTENKNWQLCCCRYNASNKPGYGEVVVFHYQLDLLDEIKSKLYRVLETETILKHNLTKVSTLTKTEKSIVALLAAGLTTKDISKQRFSSIHTVKAHRRNINEKLGINSLAELIRISDAFELNLTNHCI